MSNRRHLYFLLVLLLVGCTSISDNRPEVVRESEYFLEHGVEAYRDSDYVTASDFFSRALARYRSIDDNRGMLLSLINLAETAMATGNSDAVVRYLEQAEAVAHRSNDNHYLPRINVMRAQGIWREGDPSRVMPLLGPLLPEFDEDNRPLGTPNLVELTAIALRTDIAFRDSSEGPETAQRWLQRLEASLIRNSETTPLHNARLSRFKAALAIQEGDYTEAQELLDEALSEYRSAAHRPAIAATLTEMGRLSMAQEQWSSALDQLQRALYIRLWIMDRIGSREVLYLLGGIYSELGQETKAQQALQQAESITVDESAMAGLRKQKLR